MKNIYLRKMVFTGSFIALCAIVPLAFHIVGGAEMGKVFCPMHIPVLICGLFCGMYYGGVCGIAGPVISHLTTGMPASQMLYPMMVELLAYGFFAGLLSKFVKTKYTLVNLYICLCGSMIIGRIVSGISKALIFNVGKYSFKIWLTSGFAVALPGIAIQLLLIPLIVSALKKIVKF